MIIIISISFNGTANRSCQSNELIFAKAIECMHLVWSIFFVASSCYLICAPAEGVADRQKLGCSSYQQREHTEFISCASICAPRVYVCVGVCVQPPKAHKYTHQVYAALAQHKSAAAAAAGQVDYGQHRCMAEMFGLTPQ